MERKVAEVPGEVAGRCRKGFGQKKVNRDLEKSFSLSVRYSFIRRIILVGVANFFKKFTVKF